ncbi:glycosyl hydrolase family 65 central catalytic domain protein, partial [Opisthorchis viverrini]
MTGVTMDCPDVLRKYDRYFVGLLGEPNSYVWSPGLNDIPLNLMPYLGNGFIATQPRSPWIFLDGFFNGNGTESHRACIPSTVQWMLTGPLKVDEQGIQDDSHPQTLWMHHGMGVFLQHITSPEWDVYMTTFVSRRRPDLLVRCIEARFSQPQSTPILFQPDSAVNLDSPDCEIIVEPHDGHLSITGHTHVVESNEFQNGVSTFYMYTDVTPQELSKGFYLSVNSPLRFFLTTVSRTSMDNAISSYEAAQLVSLQDPEHLFHEQAAAWRELWEDGYLCFHGSQGEDASSTRLSRILHTAQYSLLTCFPSVSQPGFMHQPSCEFYGLCPTGLARGNEEDDYMGHVFWDMELWMLPWINLFHPQLCRLSLDYRYAMLPLARYRAVSEGFEGARFPWESAFTGLETTPWDLAAQNQIHVVGAVSFAIGQWLTTHSPCKGNSLSTYSDTAAFPVSSSAHSPDDPVEWYRYRGRILLEDIARFWSSRVQYSSTKEAYEIVDVMPPDEYTHCCRNSAYTNTIASLSLAAPAVFARYYGDPVPEEYLDWENKAKSLWMPRDTVNKVMLEHEDYVLGTCVKQADTILLTYPLMYNQPEAWKRNMVDLYAKVTDPNGPAMTWSIFCICALELKEFDRSMDYFERSIEHVHGPFLGWTEVRDGSGAANFLTGAGGFLQSIVNGFAGVRISLIPHPRSKPTCPDSVHTVAALFLTPSVPTRFAQVVSIIRLQHLHFQQRTLTIHIDLTEQNVTLVLTQGLPLSVGRLSRDKHWVFDAFRLDKDIPLQLQFQPLCIIGTDLLDDIPTIAVD